MTQAEHDHDDEQGSEVYPSEAQDMAIALRQASKRAVWYRTGEHALLARAADFIDGASGQQAAESARDLDQPRTLYRLTRDVLAGDWSFWSSAPLMESHDALIKRVAPLTMTTTEMAARNTKARKEAHDLDVDHAVALERLAIITHLQRRQSKYYAEFDKWGDPSEQERGIAYDMAWQEVQNGAHNRRAGE